MKNRFPWGTALIAMTTFGCNQTQSTSSSSSTGAGASVTTPAASAQPAPAAATPNPPGQVELAGGLKYVDLKVGDGDIAGPGQTATVHYTGWLTDGTKFDSSVDRGQPFSFVIGAGGVIRGWDVGVQGMRIGGKRKLTIPPEMGYGERGSGGVIPPNATLIFDVELLGLSH